jgi:hypothetical protein
LRGIEALGAAKRRHRIDARRVIAPVLEGAAEHPDSKADIIARQAHGAPPSDNP